MKITDIKRMNDKEMDENFNEAFSVYSDKNQKDRAAVIINPNLDVSTLLLCASHFNQALAKTIDIPYETYLKMMGKTYSFTERYGNLNISDEQLEKLIEKDIRKF